MTDESKKGWRVRVSHWSPLTWVLTLSGAFFVLFMLVTGVVVLGTRPAAKPGAALPAAKALFGGGAVGVIELNGVIMDSKRIIKKIENFAEDSEIKAIVIRINSPGGAVGPSQEIYEAVKAVSKPVVASMASVAASGGYYVACAAQKIYANPGTITGSIGVIMEFADLSKLYEWAKIKRYSIKTGKFKDAGAEYKEMSKEARQLLQGMVDDVLGQFKQAVVTGRKLPMGTVTALADGRIFSGNQAKNVKLVDELGTLNDAIAAAGRLAKIKGKPTVVYPDKPRKRFIEMLMDDGRDDTNSEASLATLVRGWLGLPKVVDSLGAGLTPGIYWLWTGGM